MEDEPLNVVAVFAHPDDEASVFGTLANHSERGDNVYVIMLTHGENASTLKGTHEEIAKTREGHVNKIEKILGAKYFLLDIPDSGVTTSIENSKRLARYFKMLKPDIVITWGEYKTIGLGHPDHRYTHTITLDAISYARYNNDLDEYPPHRKAVSLYTPIEGFDASGEAIYIDVTKQFNKIMQCFDVYEEAYGEWPVRNYVVSQMSMNGMFLGVKYAEVYHKVLTGRARKFLD
ncbi:MAG: PIG-L deacetylase family protein [Candidatus Heimdallarchaeaceae archaeon]|jgi:LmbE family N-acetylglucosaminyl deacetylase